MLVALALTGALSAMIISLPPVRSGLLRTFRRNGCSRLHKAGEGDGAVALPGSVRSHRAKVRMSSRRERPVPGAIPRDYYKRKVALFVAYEGSKYSGMQQNEGVLTVADVLEQALHRSGGIRETELQTLSKVGWVVAARTDKGVSAASNCISFKAAFPRPPDANGTTAKESRPIMSPDFDKFVAGINSELPPDVRVLGAAKPTSSFSAKDCCSGRRYEYLLPLNALSDNCNLTEFRNVLKQYEGTHSFHNFTIGNEHRCPPPPNATRYVTLSTCLDKPVSIEADGGETLQFVRIQVQGQSFMLHQIRKMVALGVLVERGLVCSDAIQRALDREVLVAIPPAPAAGLFLDSLHFTAYNKRFSKDLVADIEMESLSREREAFKMDQIYPSIARRSLEEQGMSIFFSTAANHPPKF